MDHPNATARRRYSHTYAPSPEAQDLVAEPGDGRSLQSLVAASPWKETSLDDESVFSFRKKKTLNTMTASIFLPDQEPSPFLKPKKKQYASTSQHPQPWLPSSTGTVTDSTKAAFSPIPASELPSDAAFGLGTTIQMGEKRQDIEDWNIVWKGSWVVPSLEALTSTAVQSTVSSHKGPATLKKASLDNRQHVTFQGKDGIKLQPTVTELPDVVFAVSKRSCKGLMDGPEDRNKQVMRENTEMHLIAKIRLSSFPIFLLLPGYDPRLKLYQETSMFLVYGVLGDKDAVNSSSAVPTMSFFAYPLVDHAGFSEQMFLNTRYLEQLRQNVDQAHTAEGLLSPSDTDPDDAHIQYDHPMVDSIMNGLTEAEDDELEWMESADMDLDEDKSLQQEMELLQALERSKSWSPYTVLAPPPPAPSSNPFSSSSSSATNNNFALISKDAAKDRMFSRTQTLDRMAFAAKGPSSRSTNAWSRHRSLDSHTTIHGQISSSTCTSTSTLLPTLTHTTSTGTTGSRRTITANTTRTISTKVIRKGVGRAKSPSRAPQQPLDMTTESLRRKLLGPGSVRSELPSINSMSPATSTKSIEARNKATVKGLVASVLSKINIGADHEDYKECAANLYRSVTFAMV
ncbi:hypothetical protein EDD11_006426 [Mortierella claussenii]|nr:hypothetical protein EDD11_006426 [Mortierella claussenii]